MIPQFYENTHCAALCSSPQNPFLKGWFPKDKKGNGALLWSILHLPTLLRSALLRTRVRWYYTPANLKSQGTARSCRRLLCHLTSCSRAWVLYSCLTGLHSSAQAAFVTLQLLRSTEAQDGRGQFTTSGMDSLSRENEHTRSSDKTAVMEVSNSDLSKPSGKRAHPLLYKV